MQGTVFIEFMHQPQEKHRTLFNGAYGMAYRGYFPWYVVSSKSMVDVCCFFMLPKHYLKADVFKYFATLFMLPKHYDAYFLQVHTSNTRTRS
jgi:hypothetical protein